MIMEESGEELEPLFDYSRVQPIDFFYLDDDDVDPFPIFSGGKRKRSSDPEDEKENESQKVVILMDNNDDKANKEEDWMPLPPPFVSNSGLGHKNDTFLQEIRLKKQELASFAQSAEDMLRAVMESAKRELRSSAKSALESEGDEPSKQAERQKILISIQDKDGQKQFRMYMDDKFERLFKM